jgi:hypothetical protein
VLDYRFFWNVQRDRNRFLSCRPTFIGDSGGIS